MTDPRRTGTEEARDGKTYPASDPRHPEPEGAEVETARQLEMQAADRPEFRGVSRDELRRLADEFIALDLGDDLDRFLRWVQERRSRARAVRTPPDPAKAGEATTGSRGSRLFRPGTESPTIRQSRTLEELIDALETACAAAEPTIRIPNDRRRGQKDRALGPPIPKGDGDALEG